MSDDIKTYRVLVTPTSFAQHDESIREELKAAVGEVLYNPYGRPLTAKELQAFLPDCQGYIAGLDWITAEALEAANSLKVIARYGAGVDRVDLKAAKANGITVTNTPGANATSVAELTIGLLLSLARMIPAANAATKQGEWPRLSGVSLAGKTVGLLGLGAIGKAVVERLHPFGCRLLAYDPFADGDFAKAHGVELVARDALLAQSDFVSLHVPVLDTTRGMVNAEFFSTMKRGAFLINTARGELINETALLAALESGQLRGAALDAFINEPPAADNPLLALPQVIATPHTGAHTDGAVNAMGRGALDDCLAVLRGEEPTYRIV